MTKKPLTTILELETKAEISRMISRNMEKVKKNLLTSFSLDTEEEILVMISKSIEKLRVAREGGNKDEILFHDFAIEANISRAIGLGRCCLVIVRDEVEV